MSELAFSACLKMERAERVSFDVVEPFSLLSCVTELCEHLLREPKHSDCCAKCRVVNQNLSWENSFFFLG